MSKFKKLTGFWKAYIIYALVLIILLAAVFVIVRKDMVEYEASTPEGFVLSNLEKAAKGKSELYDYLKQYCFSIDAGDGQGREKLFKDIVSSGNISISKSSKSFDIAHPVYDVEYNEEPFITMGISQGESKTILGILTMSEWDIDYCILRNALSESMPELNDNNLLDITAELPKGYTLYIDEQEYTKEASGKATVPEFADFAEYTDAPSLLSYSFNDIAFEPAFRVKNNEGQYVELKNIGGNTFVAEPKFKATAEAKDFLEGIADPLEIAKTWSLFMTDDIGGAKHGLAEVMEKCMLLEGSGLGTMAKNWASNVDIQFVSEHTIGGFNNEKADNFIKYNDSLVSCDVYFEKIVVLRTGRQLKDVFENRMYFANVNGNWRLMDMQSIK